MSGNRKITHSSILKKWILKLVKTAILVFFESLVWIKSVKKNSVNKKVWITKTSAKTNSMLKKDGAKKFIANEKQTTPILLLVIIVCYFF